MHVSVLIVGILIGGVGVAALFLSNAIFEAYPVHFLSFILAAILARILQVICIGEDTAAQLQEEVQESITVLNKEGTQEKITTENEEVAKPSLPEQSGNAGKRRNQPRLTSEIRGIDEENGDPEKNMDVANNNMHTLERDEQKLVNEREDRKEHLTTLKADKQKLKEEFTNNQKAKQNNSLEGRSEIEQIKELVEKNGMQSDGQNYIRVIKREHAWINDETSSQSSGKATGKISGSTSTRGVGRHGVGLSKRYESINTETECLLKREQKLNEKLGQMVKVREEILRLELNLEKRRAQHLQLLHEETEIVVRMEVNGQEIKKCEEEIDELDQEIEEKRDQLEASKKTAQQMRKKLVSGYQAQLEELICEIRGFENNHYMLYGYSLYECEHVKKQTLCINQLQQLKTRKKDCGQKLKDLKS